MRLSAGLSGGCGAPAGHGSVPPVDAGIEPEIKDMLLHD